MGIRQAGQRFIFFRERSEVADDRDQLGADDAERVADEDHIRIVGDITACRAEMDDPRSLGTDFPIGTNMRHHIVAGLLFDLGHAGKVDIRNLLTHLRKLRVGDGQSQLLLALSQRNPEPTPGFIAVLSGKNTLHFSRRIAAAEHALIRCVRHSCSCLPLFVKMKNTGLHPEKCADHMRRERFCTDCCPSARNGPFSRTPCRPAK